MYKPEVYIKGQRLDLFEGGNISVVSSVQNIEDISRTFNDYSQSFTVPASPNNNRIFQHWYNFSINNGFDARIRHQAHIDIQSANFKVGTIRLESCQIENNRPVNYKITFFGQLIDLKNVIGDDYLSALDLSQYDVDYTPANVTLGLTTGLASSDYIFPLISTQRQWFYNSNSSSVTFEDKLANIAWNGSAQDHGLEWTSLRPALLVMRIIEAIETRYSLTFSRDFLGTTPFNSLYMWLANQDSSESLKSKFKVTDYETVNTAQPSIGSFDNSTGTYSPTTTGASKIRNIIFLTDSVDGVNYTIQLMNGDTVLEEKTGTGNLKIDRDVPGGLAQGSAVYGRVVTSTSKTITLCRFEVDELSDDQVLFAQKTNFTVSGSIINTNQFVPKLKVIDFLKSVIKMYNLVVVPNSSTSFYINTLDDWYAEGQVYDISRFVDTSEIAVNRSKIFKEIRFAFQSPQTILAEQFEKTNNTAYGDLETKLKNADGTALDGESFEIEVDFEQMVYEKLLDLNTEEETNIVYGLSLSNSLGEVSPEPHLFYAISKDISGNPISIVDDTGTKSQLNGNVFMPSHADSDSHNYSTCFGGEVNEHTGGVNSNSLFKLFYEDYITDSFSINRRKHDVNARLPIWLLTKLQLNDRLIIGPDRYIINEMTVNATNQMAQFELLNDIYGEVSDIVVEEETPPNPTPEEPDPTQGNSFNISPIGVSTVSSACGQSASATKYWLGSDPQPTLGSFIYNDIGLTDSFDGGSLYYKIDGKVLWINEQGITISVFDCT